MTFADTAKPSQCMSRTLSIFDTNDPLDPFRHQIGRNIGKMIAGECQRRVRRKIIKMSELANLDDVSDFFYYTFHQKFLLGF